MAIELPTYPGAKSAELIPIDAGSWQEGTLGADAVRLDRLGDRFGLVVQMPPMKWDTLSGLSAARVWTSRLNRGISQGVIVEVPQPDFSTSFLPVAAKAVGSNAQSTIVPISSIPSGQYLPEGMLVTIRQTSTGRHFLHQIGSDIAADGAGKAALSLWPRIRIGLTAADFILLRTPVIEGRLVDPAPVSLQEVRTVGVSFEVREIR